MDKLKQLEELVKKITEDASKCYDKGVFSRGRSARVSLSELTKLCKEVRADLLEHMKKVKDE